jgi:hypothetical protein
MNEEEAEEGSEVYENEAAFFETIDEFHKVTKEEM